MPLRNLLSSPVLLLVMLAVPVRAHLMVAQHGTLNFVDNAVFMVISIPVSAFAGIDDNQDGKVTMFEFNRNRDAVLSAVRSNVSLTDEEGVLVLEGILLSPVTAHDRYPETLSDLTVMGRFNLRKSASALRFESRLYGDEESAQTLKMLATRRSNGYQTEFVLTPDNPARFLFVDIPQGSSPSLARKLQVSMSSEEFN
ncbi:MAG: hypothetical protein RJQ10_03255 [Haliea sp.]|uniref:hypothetical protein n=1 Tax=Haliea sp. TaxID=1932666 RepID=UPI0032ED1711